MEKFRKPLQRMEEKPEESDDRLLTICIQQDKGAKVGRQQRTKWCHKYFPLEILQGTHKNSSVWMTCYLGLKPILHHQRTGEE